MSTDWQPSAAAVERERDLVMTDLQNGSSSHFTSSCRECVEGVERIARRNLRVQHEREAPLLARLRKLCEDWPTAVWRESVLDTLKAHARLDAPPAPEPTPEQAIAEWAVGFKASVFQSFADHVDREIAKLAREKGAKP